MAAEEDLDQQQPAEQLLAQAKEQGGDLVGPRGLLNQLTKRFLETALEEEMADHIGYDKTRSSRPEPRQHPQRSPGRDGVDRDRPVEIEVPRDT